MPNNGLKQATIMYKVSNPGGVPLDLFGTPVSISGLKQAIALLNGRTNPNPSQYDVEFYFNEGDNVLGNVTQIYDPTSCPISFMNITPAQIILHLGAVTQYATIFSTNTWQLVSGSPNIATVSPTTGSNGSTSISFTRTATLGQRYYVFKDSLTNQTVQVYVINVSDPDAWILGTGIWDNLAFWKMNGIWQLTP